jgi:hypothetical protein
MADYLPFIISGIYIVGMVILAFFTAIEIYENSSPAARRRNRI